jgi:hypothetical protein
MKPFSCFNASKYNVVKHEGKLLWKIRQNINLGEEEQNENLRTHYYSSTVCLLHIVYGYIHIQLLILFNDGHPVYLLCNDRP